MNVWCVRQKGMYEDERGIIKGVCGFYYSGTDAESIQPGESRERAGNEDDVERKYEEAVALLPEEKQQAVRAYCDAIFDSGADAEQFFYRLGLRDGIRLHKIVKSIIKEIS